jgi:hypothetical protein
MDGRRSCASPRAHRSPACTLASHKTMVSSVIGDWTRGNRVTPLRRGGAW